MARVAFRNSVVASRPLLWRVSATFPITSASCGRSRRLDSRSSLMGRRSEIGNLSPRNLIYRRAGGTSVLLLGRTKIESTVTNLGASLDARCGGTGTAGPPEPSQLYQPVSARSHQRQRPGRDIQMPSPYWSKTTDQFSAVSWASRLRPARSCGSGTVQIRCSRQLGSRNMRLRWCPRPCRESFGRRSGS